MKAAILTGSIYHGDDGTTYEAQCMRGQLSVRCIVRDPGIPDAYKTIRVSTLEKMAKNNDRLQAVWLRLSVLGYDAWWDDGRVTIRVETAERIAAALEVTT